jgi:hypothetical protein
MFTLTGFLEDIDPGAAWTQLAALADQHIKVVGDDLYVPNDLPNIAAAAFGIDTTTEAFVRIVSPSLRARSNIYFEPTNGQSGAAQEPNSPQIATDLRSSPIPLVPGEQLNCETNSNPGAAQDQWGLLWLSDGPLVPVEGDIFTVPATNTTTLTANAWTNGALTFSSDLPRGRYAVVGMRARSAGLVAARLVFIGGRWRPGVLGTDTVGDIEAPMFRLGGMGEFGQFEDDEAPSVDFLSISADSAQDVILDLIQVRAGPAG